MTNGEKIKEIFPYLESDDTDLVKVLNIDNLKNWWNAEYKEPTTKNDLVVDCNNCKNNFHRGDRTSYCATGDGMCHYECEETILDKIRAEIEQLSPYNKFTGASYPAYEFKPDVLQIIDKYKAESEDNNAEGSYINNSR